MFSLQRFTQCGVILAALTGFSNIAAAVPIFSFQFNGGSLVVDASTGGSPAEFSFVNGFTIIAQNGAASGDLFNLTGEITGVFQFDDPAGANTVALINPIIPNTLIIDDGTDLFTANINLIQLQGGGLGGSGAITGAIDFFSSTYTGSNAGLAELNALIENTPNIIVTFQLPGIVSLDLDNLFDNGSGGIVAYSAAVNITPIAEPAPLALLGLGLLCSAAYVSRRRSKSKS